MPVDAGGFYVGKRKPCELKGERLQVKAGGYRERMAEYKALVNDALVRGEGEQITGTPAHESEFPKSREQFLEEARKARSLGETTGSGSEIVRISFEEVAVHSHLTRLDSRHPQEVADEGGFLGGHPDKPDGTVFQHTTLNQLRSSHGTRSYTSTSVGIVEDMFVNEFVLGTFRPTAIVLRDGSIWRGFTASEFWDRLGKDDNTLVGAVAVWESYLYHGHDVEGVRVSGGANSKESEVITRGFAPSGFQQLFTFQPIIVNVEEGGMYQPRLPFERAGRPFAPVTDYHLGPYQKIEWTPAAVP